VHIGDGEFIDVERKAELGGNIHAKGMMIMQAFLMSELELEQQLPFSASLTFEQSYSEVDGDSASMAELCALISALANVPINQSIAITGSVDQFGRVQPVGGLNEKIEGFFTICQQRGLTGKQGVIIPAPTFVISVLATSSVRPLPTSLPSGPLTILPKRCRC
jgi:Lon-like ATP-dependent protease